MSCSACGLLEQLVNLILRPDEFAELWIDESEPRRQGHRFAADEYIGVHPMAINNATGCFRDLQVHGRRCTYTDRYESWVQYQSRRPLPRVDLRPLADALNSIDTSTAPHAWIPYDMAG